jgi:hypothetical protein
MDKLYGSALVQIPTPRFYVLYNGEQKLESQTLRLSDAYIIQDAVPALELAAKVVNINYGSGEAALSKSVSLNGYSFLIAEIRKSIRSGMARDKAIVNAIQTCIGQDILSQYLKENYGEVIKMLNYEYDAEAEQRVIRLESYQEGRQETWQLASQETMSLLTKLQRGELSFEDAFEKARCFATEGNDADAIR